MHFDRLRRNWENLGKKDPMWAVLTKPGTEGGRWDEREFYRTGQEFVEWLGSWLGLHEIAIPKGPALDFGCGAGRLTFALAPHFATITGVDVSAPMIAFANERNQEPERVRFVCNARDDLSVFEDQSFEFVLTMIVLQHMRAEYSLRYLAEFLRILKPGGLLVFQMATKELDRSSGSANKSHAPETEPQDEAHMEIHCAPFDQIVATIEAGAGELLQSGQDRRAGEHWESFHFAVRKHDS